MTPRHVVVRGIDRADPAVIDALGALGTATVHEALGRRGFVGPHVRPIQQGARLAGSAVTVACHPGDNLMVHAAVEVCQAGDVLVVTNTAPSTHGMFGELLATSLMARGVRSLVIDAGVRDTAELRAMGFAVWSQHVSCEGTVKASAGSVNVPVVLGAQTVHPGDVVCADDDGVVVVPRSNAAATLREARQRVSREETTRARLAEGELGIDIYGLRRKLDELGVEYPGVTRIAVLGLGEAGAALAADLAVVSGPVAGYDPAAVRTPEGVVRHDEPVSAVAGTDLVVAVTPASGAAAALESVLGALPRGAIYADLSTSAPGLKHQLATTAAAARVGFVDVALMAPVPGNGIRTPTLAAGSAAEAFASTMRPLGMPVEVVGPDAGQAALRKLLRSVVMKGLAQLLIEALTAAEAAGLVDETWDQLVSQLSSVDEALVRRLVTGTPRHARRRLDEMVATIGLLGELGVDTTMSEATTARLRHIVSDPASVPQPPSAQ